MRIKQKDKDSSKRANNAVDFKLKLKELMAEEADQEIREAKIGN